MPPAFAAVLIGISLMITDAEHLFIYVLAVCVSSLEKRLISSFTHFLKLGCFLFCFVVGVCVGFFAVEVYEFLSIVNIDP